MTTFDELMEQFRNPPAEGIPENFADELTSTYQEEISVREAAITEREERLAAAEAARAERDAEVMRLKAVNYDLIKAAPKAGSPAENNEPDGAAAQGGIDSLFE